MAKDPLMISINFWAWVNTLNDVQAHIEENKPVKAFNALNDLFDDLNNAQQSQQAKESLHDKLKSK